MERKSVGPFKILKRLGNNRRHQVFHARQTEQNRDVAIKFIKIPPTVEWESAVDKISREVDQLQKLRHPNLVQLYGAGFENKDIFFATELIDGESLATILARRGKLAPDQVVEYGRQICSVLQFLHEHDLIHSKLTPEKILVTSDHQIKVNDLRLNRSKRRRWDAQRQRDLELAAYMAPEQFLEGATDKSDLYALGVIQYEMLSGKLPYKPDTLGRMQKNKATAPVPSVATHVMDCPIWLNQIVTEMLDPNPRKRPHSAQAINLALDEIKNIDATKKAAVSQMTSGFNPLTVGKDKSEAHRLLGKKTVRKKTAASTPFVQRTTVQVGSLCLCGALIFFMLQPKSDHKIIAQARQMVDSEQMAQWTEARVLLEPIMSSDRFTAKEAKRLYFDSKHKTLMVRAETGKNSPTDSEAEKMFVKAVGLKKLGQIKEAESLLQSLIDPAELMEMKPDQYVRRAAMQQLELLEGEKTIAMLKECLSNIAATAEGTTEHELHVVEVALKQVVESNETVRENVKAFATEQLKVIQKQRAELRREKESEKEPTSGREDSGSPPR